jgi:hypothetical protein
MAAAGRKQNPGGGGGEGVNREHNNLGDRLESEVWLWVWEGLGTA